MKLQDENKELQNVVSSEKFKDRQKITKDLSDCIKEVQNLVGVCCQSAEGAEPNVSMLLGIRSSSSMSCDAGYHGDTEEDSLKRQVEQLQQIRQDIELLRGYLSDKYAEAVGENCVTQWCGCYLVCLATLKVILIECNSRTVWKIGSPCPFAISYCKWEVVLVIKEALISTEIVHLHKWVSSFPTTTWTVHRFMDTIPSVCLFFVTHLSHNVQLKLCLKFTSCLGVVCEIPDAYLLVSTPSLLPAS